MYEIYQRLLDKKGLKNADVSRTTGVSNMTLSDWKRGVSTPKSTNMSKIAEFLEVTEDYLRTGQELEFTAEMAETDLALSNMNKQNKKSSVLSIISYVFAVISVSVSLSIISPHYVLHDLQ